MSFVRAKLAGDGRRSLRTRDEIITALREYAEAYGPGFTAAAFSPSAAKWNDRPELVERYYAGRPSDGRPWPSLNSIKTHFNGSFNAARVAAGLEPNRPGPRERRPARQHAPIREVRERLVHVSDERLERAHHSKKLAEQRAQRAVERAERLQRKLTELQDSKPQAPSRVIPAVRTVTKRVEPSPGRSAERLHAQLEDERAAYRALRDQASASVRDLERAEAAVERARGEAQRAVRDAELARQAQRKGAERVVRLEERVATLASELEAERSRTREAAASAAEVRRAKFAASRAEQRAESAERDLREHVAAITGEARKLTHEELDALRHSGPAGPALMARALRNLKLARTSEGNVKGALQEVARAALAWRDRL